MKHYLTVYTFFALLGMTTTANATNTLLQTNTGFYLPANMWHSQSNYLSYGQHNSKYANKCHLASDYGPAANAPVYAIADGTVYSARTDVGNYGGDTPAKSGGAIIISHRNAKGEVFYALYGHVKDFQVATGDFVVAGQQIANIGPYVSAGTSLPHLHFGINSNIPSYTGYTPTSACTDFLGFVDPETYLTNNAPGPHEYQGAGSLIQTESHCYGCSYDQANAHSTAKGMVTFQWKWDATNCDHINITAENSAGNVWSNPTTKKPLTVGIIAGSWNTRDADKYYVATLPISIGYPRETYSLVSVLLPSANVGEIALKATCDTATAIDTKTETSRNQIGVALFDGIDWNKKSTWFGQGSVISQNTNTASDFGKIRDEATLTNNLAVAGTALFQWQPSSRCEALILDTLSKSPTSVKLSIKDWNGAQNSLLSKEVTLPYTVDNSFGKIFNKGIYYLINVNVAANVARSNEHITAVCVDK